MSFVAGPPFFRATRREREKAFLSRFSGRATHPRFQNGTTLIGSGSRREALTNPHAPWWLTRGPVRRLRVLRDDEEAALVDLVCASFEKLNSKDFKDDEIWHLLRLFGAELVLMFRRCRSSSQLVVYDFAKHMFHRFLDVCIGRHDDLDTRCVGSTERAVDALFSSSHETKWEASAASCDRRRVIGTGRTATPYRDAAGRSSMTGGRLGALAFYEIVHTPRPWGGCW